jgi:hypothetical protein
MRSFSLLFLAAAAFAGCDSGGKDSASPPVVVDDDGDGFEASEDCDDADAAVNPAAEEVCNGIDDNCDGVVDENQPDADADGVPDCSDVEECDGADNDGDGLVDEDSADTDKDGIADCVDAEECDGLDNDGDGSIDEDFPDTDKDGICDAIDVEECDGLDNDGDGAVDEDFPDTDKDATADCVDVEECDGLDNDGDGEIDEGLDVDKDGYSLCVDDCDDTNPAVHPGATDWMNDGVDSDCDGAEPAMQVLDHAPILIDGTSGQYDLVGLGLDACDFDEDGLDDLLIGAPFGHTYAGQAGIFYGSGSGAWSKGMQMTDADVLIQGTGYDFIGFNAQCGDVDGDGHADVVFSRGEIDFSPYVTTYAIMIYYGDGISFPATLTPADADAILSLTLGAVTGASVVYASEFTLGDIDDDGADDILVEWPYTTLHGAGEILVLPGERYIGKLDLDDEISEWWSPDQPMTGSYAYQQVLVLDDFDGDGLPDVMAAEPYWSDPDSADLYQGHTSFLSGVEGSEGGSLAGIAWSQLYGESATQYFGYWGASGDFDSDGVYDGVLSGIGDSTGASLAGGLWVWSDFGTFLATDPTTPTASATAHVYGTTASGMMGYRLDAAGDVDGDGYEDLLVSEPLGGTAMVGRVWLLSGALLTGDSEVQDAALFGVEGNNTDNLIGSSVLGRADFDGDGTPDIALAAVNWDDTDSSLIRSGRVAVWLSSAW